MIIIGATMTYFFWALGGAVVGFLLSGWIFFYQLLLLRNHVKETREIMERNDCKTDTLQGKISELEGNSPDEPRSMWN